MAFRDDLSALENRREALQRELSDIRERKRELEGLEGREKHLEHALAETTSVLAGMPGWRPRALPLLDQVQVASPCSASWDEMQGNGRVRFCNQCAKNVYNVSSMPADEAEELLRSRGDLCIRLYRRADGTVLTADCPEGVRIRREKRRRLAWAAVGGSLLATGAAAALAARLGQASHVQGEVNSRFQAITVVEAGNMRQFPEANVPFALPDELPVSAEPSVSPKAKGNPGRPGHVFRTMGVRRMPTKD